MQSSETQVETSILVALIAASATVAGAITAGLFSVRAARVKAKEEVKAQATEKVVEELSERSIVDVHEFEAVTTFDDSGAGNHIRKWIDLKTTQSINNLKIPLKFELSPGATGEEPVVDSLPGSKLGAHFELNLLTATTIDGYAVLEGLISPDTGFVGFTARHQFKDAFCMTKEAALSTYKGESVQMEYAVTAITTPAKVLRRSVNFPISHRNLAPPPQALVLLGDKEVVDSDEIARVKPGLTLLDNSATLIVNDPKGGRRYGISWMPPAAAH